MNPDVLATCPLHVREEYMRQRRANRLLARALQLGCERFRTGPISEVGWYNRLLSDAAVELGTALEVELTDDEIEQIAKLLAVAVIE